MEKARGWGENVYPASRPKLQLYAQILASTKMALKVATSIKLALNLHLRFNEVPLIFVLFKSNILE